MRLILGIKLFDFLNQCPRSATEHDGFAYRLLNMECVPPMAKLNYVEAELEDGRLKLSYLPDSRKAEDVFVNSQRQSAKPITVLKKLLPDADLPVLNTWIDTLKTHFAVPEHKIEIAKGEDMLFMYNGENYKPSGGSTLGQSCMRYQKCQDFINFYVRNKNAVHGVWVNMDNSVVARALVWNATYNRKKVSVLDRIYSTTDAVGNILVNWSKNNCDFTIDHKTKLFFDNKEQKETSLDLYVGLDYIDAPYPYLDNFKYLMGHRLYNILCPKIAGRLLTDTNGTFATISVSGNYKPGLVYEQNQGKWIKKEDVILLGDRYIYKDDIVPCVVCANPLYSQELANRWSLNGTTVVICLKHTKPYIINDIQYSSCGEHRLLFTEQCIPCSTRPRYCSRCGTCTREYTQVNDNYYCPDCSSDARCDGCEQLCALYLLQRYYNANNNAVNYCSTCRDSWSRCIYCQSRVIPGCVCPCEADYSSCNGCEERVFVDDVCYFEGDEYCDSCFDTRAFCCTWCDETCSIQNISELADVCNDCYNNNAYTCLNCSQRALNTSGFTHICLTCADALRFRCEGCAFYRIDASPLVNTCLTCYNRIHNV